MRITQACRNDIILLLTSSTIILLLFLTRRNKIEETFEKKNSFYGRQ